MSRRLASYGPPRYHTGHRERFGVSGLLAAIVGGIRIGVLADGQKTSLIRPAPELRRFCTVLCPENRLANGETPSRGL